MKHWVRMVSAIAACAFLSCCATLRTEAKKQEEEPPGLSVRLPVANAATMNIESQPSLGYPELPLSVADETRGRWLTLFELNYTPAKRPAPLHPTFGEAPSR